MAKFGWTLNGSEIGELWLDGTYLRELQSISMLEQKFTELFESLYGPIYRYLRSITGSQSEAEDLAQDVFSQLLTHLKDGRSIDNTRAWVFKIAHNLAIDHLRRIRPLEQPLPEDWQGLERKPDLAPSAEQRLLEWEQRKRVNRAMLRLSQQERSCLELRAEGLKYREIAEVLGVSVSSVQTFLVRGIKKIDRELHD